MGCSMLQSCPSEPCLPVYPHQASAQAVHITISALHCDNPQAGPRTCKLILQYKGTTHCLYHSPLHAHPVEKAGYTEQKFRLPRPNYTDDQLPPLPWWGCTSAVKFYISCLLAIGGFSLRLMSTKCQILKANKISLI